MDRGFCVPVVPTLGDPSLASVPSRHRVEPFKDTDQWPVEDRFLDERSYLEFIYEVEKPYTISRIILPFYENPIIKETATTEWDPQMVLQARTARWMWKKTPAKKYSLSFNLTLPHLMRWAKRGSDYYKTYQGRHGNIDEMKGDYLRDMSREFDAIKGQGKTLGQDAWNRFTDTGKSLLGLGFAPGDPDVRTAPRELSLIMWWINVIRTSTLPHGEIASTSPPEIRLNHGILYNNIPCICEKFSIDFDENAGYDLRSLMNRKIKIGMSLAENRITAAVAEGGGAMPYKPYTNQGDVMPGWGSLFKYGTLDPHFSGK